MAESDAKPKGKKKGRYVPSRYMQAAENFSYVSSREKSSIVKNSKEESSGNSSQDNSGRSSQSGHGMTSTPTSAKGLFSFPMLDASAVTDSQGHLTVPPLKGRIVPTPADSRKRNLIKLKLGDETLATASVVAKSKDKKKTDSFDLKRAQAEIDLMYADYLQSAFLANQSKQALEAKCLGAVETLHKLMVLFEQLLHKAKSQRMLLRVISILINVYEHCQKQEAMLKPVFEIIPVLERRYRSLAEAVDVTKHKLHVKDVILPDPDCNEVAEFLLQMTEMINALFESLPAREDVISSSAILENFVDTGELLANALKRGVGLLTEAQELYFSEASLALGSENL